MNVTSPDRQGLKLFFHSSRRGLAALDHHHAEIFLQNERDLADLGPHEQQGLGHEDAGKNGQKDHPVAFALFLVRFLVNPALWPVRKKCGADFAVLLVMFFHNI